MTEQHLEPIKAAVGAGFLKGPHAHLHLTSLNDHEVTLAVNEVAYPWHHHPRSDELLLVLEGLLKIHFGDDRQVELRPGEAFVVPAGTKHMTAPQGRTVNLIIRRSETETIFVVSEPAV